jgi:hypothetical protein
MLWQAEEIRSISSQSNIDFVSEVLTSLRNLLATPSVDFLGEVLSSLENILVLVP